MNCVIVNGIADAGRADLARQVDGFCAALAADGHRVRRFDLAARPPKPCLGCFACWVATPGRCVHADGTAEILAAMVRSDRVVHVSDFHLHFPSALSKAVMDRAIPLARGYMHLAANGRLGHLPRYRTNYKTMLLMENHPRLDDADLRALTAAIGGAKGVALGAYRLDLPAKELCNALYRD